jgi:hypothetical protein
MYSKGRKIIKNITKKIVNYRLKLINESYVSRILKNNYYMNYIINLKEKFTKFIKDNNINTDKFYKKLAENMKNNILFKETINNKEFMNILKNMNIIKSLDKYYNINLEDINKLEKEENDEEIITNAINSGELFVFGINNEYPIIIQNIALLTIINKTYLEIYIEDKHYKDIYNKNNKYDTNYVDIFKNNKYVDKIIYTSNINKKINTVQTEFMNYIIKQNINTTDFYNKMLKKMEETGKIYSNTLKKQKYLNILKNMYIVEDIDDIYKKISTKTSETLVDNYIKSLELYGILFVFGKNKKIKPTNINNGLLNIINELYKK